MVVVCYVMLVDMIALLASRAQCQEIALIRMMRPWMRSSAIIVGKLGIHLLNAPNLFMLLFTFWVTLYHFKFHLGLCMLLFTFWVTLYHFKFLLGLCIHSSHNQFKSILLVVALSDTSHCIVLMYIFWFKLTYILKKKNNLR